MSSLLPPNASPTERAIEATVGRCSDLPIMARYLWDPARCPEHLLPWLAWALSVDEWDSQWPAAQQREAIASSVELHRKKGTPWAVKRALQIAGFGGQHRITEGRIARRYDGAIFCDSSEVYGGHSWAEFTLDADLGETAGLDAGTAARVAEIVREWAPVSRHLTRLGWRADISDSAPSRDQTQATATLTASDQRPWRRTYDGSLRYDQGALLACDGATLADGYRRYQGWGVEEAHWRAGQPESDTTLALDWSGADRQQALPRYDGATQADGSSDYGDAAPVAQDAVMPITAVRHIRYDGRYRYGADNICDGATLADGSRRYSAGRIASGDEITYLEAA